MGEAVISDRKRPCPSGTSNSLKCPFMWFIKESANKRVGRNVHVVDSEERCMRVHEILQNSTSCKILVTA